jgi:hypothetical protein
MKTDISMSIHLTEEEAKSTEEYMFKYLVKAGWFNTIEEAKNWAGEVLFEAMLTYLEALGIDISFED